jgi:hypothetical protein
MASKASYGCLRFSFYFHIFPIIPKIRADEVKTTIRPEEDRTPLMRLHPSLP